MKRAFIAVEGPHDVELVGTLLASLDKAFKRLKLKSEVDSSWYSLIPTSFPIRDDIARRVPVPIFFQSPTHSIAVMVGGGDGSLVKLIEENRIQLAKEPDMFGLVMDADRRDPSERWTTVRAKLLRKIPSLSLPSTLGEVESGPPRFGVFMLPDNTSPGTLEDLLVEAAAEVYPTFLKEARTYLTKVDESFKELEVDERKDFEKPAGRAKATVACISAILKPGKAIQVSIQDNRWFRDARTLQLPRIAAVRRFLATLLELACT